VSSATDSSLTAGSARERVGARVLTACCGAHALHDGYSDLLYLLLPVWQGEFALSLAQSGLLKTVYSGIMAGLQMPVGLLAEKFGERALLVLGTILAALAFILAGWSGGFPALVACLALGGLGASVQHPLSSSLTARAFLGPRLRAALGTYNFSGDVGKMLFPAAAAWLAAAWHWRAASESMGACGLVVAAALFLLLPRRVAKHDAQAGSTPAAATISPLSPSEARRAFASLSLIGVIDSATRSGFLMLLPFLLTGKGAALPLIGTALTLVFAGGAAGKFVCGVLAQRLGILRTVVLTEAGTALGIVAVLALPLGTSVLLLPLLGVALNGTSSVLYGTVAELAPFERRARVFGLFYTCTIGAGAVSPSLVGLLSDHAGVAPTLAAVAVAVLMVLPLALPLRPALRRLAERG
jgi:FSR family fosmidomycin resistance protein-like MFS transporter